MVAFVLVSFLYFFYYIPPRPRPRPNPPAPGGGGGGSIPGAPTPCTGAAPNPMGGAPGGGPPVGMGGAPMPLPREAMPVAALLVGGGGPSTAKATTFSPRINTNPSVRFSVLSSSKADPPPLGCLRSCRNSSASLKTRFRCLSKAKKVPTMDRESCSVTLSLCSTYRKSLLPFPVGYISIE